MSSIPALALQGVTAGYVAPRGKFLVLDGVSFTVQNGEWISVVGPSGCGKTTLLRVCAGLLPPWSGIVRVFGGSPRGKTSYMPQGDSLLPWRTALGNLLAVLEVDGRPMPEAVRKAKGYLAQFGLAGFEKSYPFELSGGMRQRVALLRAFLAQREILLLDEPLGALDALTRAELQEWLFSVWKNLRKTVVLVTHDVEEALLLSDRVLVFSAWPAKVIAELSVSKERPRSRTDPQIQGLREEILGSLQKAKGHEKVA